jgi:hypothetical protein
VKKATTALLIAAVSATSLWLAWSLGRRSAFQQVEQALMPERFAAFDSLLRSAPHGELVAVDGGRLGIHRSWPEGTRHFLGYRSESQRCLWVPSGVLWPGLVACCSWDDEPSACHGPLGAAD